MPRDHGAATDNDETDHSGTPEWLEIGDTLVMTARVRSYAVTLPGWWSRGVKPAASSEATAHEIVIGVVHADREIAAQAVPVRVSADDIALRFTAIRTEDRALLRDLTLAYHRRVTTTRPCQPLVRARLAPRRPGRHRGRER